MKKKRMSLVGLVALVACALLASCSDVGTMSGGTASDVYDIPIAITNIPTDYQAMVLSGSSLYGARTILPDNPYDVASDGLVWKLSGVSTSGLSYPATTVQVVAGKKTVDGAEVTDGSTGTANLAALGPYVWELTMTAYLAKKNATGAFVDSTDTATTDPTKYVADTSKRVLVGYTSIDLRGGATSVTFSMIKSGLDTEGTVRISGQYVDGVTDATDGVKDNAVSYYIIGLYNRITGVVEKDADGDDLEARVTSLSHADNPQNYWNLAYGTASEPISALPGTYLFAITFYNSSDVKIGYYSDLLVVDPGYPLVHNIGVIDVINKIPNAPSNFRAYFIDDSEDVIEGFYKVRFEWADNSNNETNFEIELREAAGAAPVKNPVVGSKAVAGTANETKGYWEDSDTVDSKTVTDIIRLYGLEATDDATDGLAKPIGASDIYGSTLWSAGSLRAGSKTLTMYLELGKVYEARIRALNETGVSAWVEREASDSTTSTITAGTDVTGFKKGSSYNSATFHINRLRIEYNLNGDKTKLYLASDESYDKRYTAYETYTGETETVDTATVLKSKVLAINATPKDDDGKEDASKAEESDYAFITGGLGSFKYWGLESNDTEEVKYYEYANLQLKAIYDFSAIINVAGYEDLKKSDITFTLYESDKTTEIENEDESIGGDDAIAYSKGDNAAETDAQRYATIKGFYYDGDNQYATYLGVEVDEDAGYDYFKFVIANDLASDAQPVYSGSSNTFGADLGLYDGGTYIIKVLARKNLQWYSATYITTISK